MKLKKKIFKAGNYGTKGSFSKDKLTSWVGKEFSITAGHIGDWKKNGYPTTAIPIAGTCKATGVDEDGYLLGEFTYNKFGEEIKEQYPNLSIGIGADGTPNHIAILGYAPPHLKDLDTSFSEFSVDLTDVEDSNEIEFAEDDKKDDKNKANTTQDIIDEFLVAIEGADLIGVDFSKLQSKVWEMSDINGYINLLKEKGYEVKKVEGEFSGMTPEDIYEKVKAEFARDTEKKAVKEKLLKKFPPVCHNMVEFAIDKAFDEKEYSNIIEFSEEEKGTMADKLKEFSEKGTPFDHLFKKMTPSVDTGDKAEESVQEKAQRIARLI